MDKLNCTIEKLPPTWLNGKYLNEVEFCEEFLYKYPLVCIGGRFFSKDVIIHDEEEIRKPHITSGIDFPNDDDGVKIQFQFLVNEMPVTYTSKKVRTIIKTAAG